MVSVSAEVSSLRKLESESKRLYAILQDSVDEQVKEVGFIPDATRYGMLGDTTKPVNGSAVKPAAPKAAEFRSLAADPRIARLHRAQISLCASANEVVSPFHPS